MDSARNDRRFAPFGATCQSLQKAGRAVWVVTLSLALAWMFACSRDADPQANFDRAEQALHRGDIATAGKEAGKGYADFHTLSADWAWKFIILRGRVLHWRGLNDEVLKLLASESTPVPSSELAVRKLRLESVAYASLHRFPESEKKLTEAEQLCAASDYPACADVVTSRGKFQMEQGHYAQGQNLFERVLAAARKQYDPFMEANALLDLTWAANEQTHFDDALYWANSAREISTAQGFADIAQTALGNMGWAYYKLGDSEKAEAMFVEATGQAEKLDDVVDQLRWVTARGYLDLDTGEVLVAEQSFRKSLDLAKKTENREDIVNSRIALAFVCEQTGKLEDAKQNADEALSMAQADGNKRDATYPRLVQGRVAAQQHDPAAAEAAFHEVAESKDSPTFLKWEAERSLARLYEDESHIDAARREYRVALSTFEAARSEVKRENSRLPFLNNATRIYDDYIQFLIKQHKSDEALQVAEYSRARTLNEGLGFLKITRGKSGSTFPPGPLDAPQIARRVGGVIFFYWLGEKQSYLWAVTPQKTTLFPLPPAPEIQASVQRYRKTLLGPLDPLATSNDDGLALYRTLVEPAASLLKKDAKVFIIPDGSLNTINFETLLVPGPSPHYWIEDVALADASSLRMLAAARADNKPTGSLLLIGDAVSPNADYPELRKAAAEIENVDKHFPTAQQQIFAREHATPAAYLESKPEQFSYIHFVAHGTASRTNPLDSAIVLSKAGAADDSFKLYARDIIHHPLHAELVTISTCYGAGSRAYSGEGLVGLSWAFLRTGAHNVIGALWEVSDVSTPGLMDELYAGLKKGKSPEAALRAAKLSMLHSGHSFARPFYWAPFQLYTGS
jgi:CHAT domain-containing protein